MVFDLGGTHFRAGVLDENDDIVRLSRLPAISRRTSRDPVPTLQNRLISHVVDTASDLAAATPTRLVGVSIGAAVNHTTGRVIGSGPLWGPTMCDFDLASLLGRARPDLTWTVLNDVTALATALLKQLPMDMVGLAAAATVSSGIAYRTIDLATGAVPVDPAHGLQGEIGHLPAEALWLGRRLAAPCDCGLERHVSSFSSGPGIVRLLRDDPDLAALSRSWADRDAPEHVVLAAFAGCVRAGDRMARLLLDAVTRPVAHVLLYQATLNPQVIRTVLSGGVVTAFGDDYLRSLLANLADMELYGVAPDYFPDRIALASPDGFSALRGAGLRARGATRRGDERW